MNKDCAGGLHNNSDATAGEASWDKAKTNLVSWITAGANNVPLDRDGLADDTVVVGNTAGSTITIDVTRSVKQIFASKTNHGWLLVIDINAQMRCFWSKNADTSTV